MATPTIKYVVADQIPGVPAYSASGTFATSANIYPPVPFGMEVRFRDNQTGSTNAGACVAVMCQGSNVTAAGQFVQIWNNSAVLLASGNSTTFFPVGIAGAAASATNVWCWVGIEGKFDNAAFTNVSYPAGERVYYGTVAGQVHPVSASAVGSRIPGIIAWTSYTSADTYGSVQLARPSAPYGVTASN